MHQLIASFLFQNKTCPLPGLGTLYISTGNSEANFSNKSFSAPSTTITFENKENDAGSFLDYVAAKTNQTVLQSIETLSQFCKGLKSSTIANNPATLHGVGEFFSDASGNIQFKSNQLPAVFLQPVIAERVIHPQAEHTILVGDKETTNTVMTEYYTEVPVKKNRWWIWSVVLGAIALLAILIYYNSTSANAMLGNCISIQ